MARSKLERVLAELEVLHGAVPKPKVREPFALALWENVAYLVDDERRAKAFAALEQRVGLDPRSVAAARIDVLLEVATLGGIHAAKRAERLHECAELALDVGDFARALRGGGAPARRILKRFPSIGEPGAEKILLFSGIEPVLALESNGLRVLLRLGYGEESKNYARSYRTARDAASNELAETFAALTRAHGLLRRHGQRLCKNAAPDCDACPLVERCEYGSKRD